MSDIVERLRSQGKDAFGKQYSLGMFKLCDEAASEIERLRACLERLANAEALRGIRKQVAGWNGEGREGGPFQPHPPKLGAELPKTNCGAVYELDAALEEARTLTLPSTQCKQGGNDGAA